MNYCIYFDESNKLDQPGTKYSYYCAVGMTTDVAQNIKTYIDRLNAELNSKSEMHFVNYTQDTNFEKYVKSLHYLLSQPIQMNMMIVDKEDAKNLTKKMEITMEELRELFYVKIPERLFYGVTRKLPSNQQIKIIIDQNSEYKKINLDEKIKEQMNAHSACRNKAYKVTEVRQEISENDVLLQLTDVLMGIVIFILESQHVQFERNPQNITLDVKCDLIFRLLLEQKNLNMLHNKIMLYQWKSTTDVINLIELSRYTGDFILSRTKYDLTEMTKLAMLIAQYPNKTSKFYREKMGYTRQLRKLLGYIDELNGKGRNGFYFNKHK